MDFTTQPRDCNESEFGFFQSLSHLFLTTYFVKRRRTLLELNSYGPYQSSEREIKFRRFKEVEIPYFYP